MTQITRDNYDPAIISDYLRTSDIDEAELRRLLSEANHYIYRLHDQAGIAKLHLKLATQRLDGEQNK